METIEKYQAVFNSNNIKQNIESYFQLHEKNSIFEHTEEVIKEAVQLAKLYKLDQEKCEITALLHDIGRIIKKEDMVNLCREANHKFEEGEIEFPSILHQIASRILAEKVFYIADVEILNAVSVHTTLKANPSKLEMVLFLADKLSWKEEELQETVITMKKLVESSLEEAISYYFNELHQNRSTLTCYHIKSQEAYTYFCTKSRSVSSVRHP